MSFQFFYESQRGNWDPSQLLAVDGVVVISIFVWMKKILFLGKKTASF